MGTDETGDQRWRRASSYTMAIADSTIVPTMTP